MYKTIDMRYVRDIEILNCNFLVERYVIRFVKRKISKTDDPSKIHSYTVHPL
jgi:hypothetical protein